MASKLRGWLDSLIRAGARERKIQCSVCQHFCDVHRMPVGPPPEGLDMGDAFICAKCGRLSCFACQTQYVLAMLNGKCPECGGRVTKVPVWRERTTDLY